MDQSKIMLAMPTRGWPNFNTVHRFLALQEKFPDVIYHIEPGGLCVSDVRNKIVKKFLTETECEVLIQVDDDVVPRMSVFEMADHEYDIVGATYHIIRHEMNLPFPAVFTYKGPHYVPIEGVFGRTGLVPCDAVATGCMAIKRHVLTHSEMKAPFLIKYDDWGIIHFSDDMHFCYRARALGFTIAADYDRHADHIPSGVSLNRISYQYTHAYQQARKKEREAEAKKVIVAH